MKLNSLSKIIFVFFSFIISSLHAHNFIQDHIFMPLFNGFKANQIEEELKQVPENKRPLADICKEKGDALTQFISRGPLQSSIIIQQINDIAKSEILRIYTTKSIPTKDRDSSYKALKYTFLITETIFKKCLQQETGLQNNYESFYCSLLGSFLTPVNLN